MSGAEVIVLVASIIAIVDAAVKVHAATTNNPQSLSLA
jgi:hypothetical protein